MPKKMTEDDFREKILRPNFEHCGYLVKRVEGMPTWPDLLVVKNGRDTWLELKTIDEYPKHKETTIKPDWRPGQLTWMKRYRERGGFAYLALWIAGDVYFLIPQATYTLAELTKLHRGIAGGQYDKGSNK